MGHEINVTAFTEISLSKDNPMQKQHASDNDQLAPAYRQMEYVGRKKYSSAEYLENAKAIPIWQTYAQSKIKAEINHHNASKK